ncbi:uridine phosphorylase [Vallitalea longa]|uniref:Uridine phosphorylase n=1 Tax=Vallitalea longa TaxID=2936439 RepID=A0A9W5YAK6_9FIRM|nr:nucleoside phosphorylase [Vallitalea longa]GKX30415.1 uridine phosphorylase [Vallitalea longa]
MKQPHILCSENDIEKMVVLPGDPERVLRVAGFLDTWEEVAYNREFRTIKGTYKEVPITVTSTGIGGASATIALEELITCGAEYFIRIGSAGACQSQIDIGDLIISTGAVREEGASRMYVSQNYPAVASFNLLRIIDDTCTELGYKPFIGITRSHDSFYIDNERQLMKHWNTKNVLGSDMETSAIYTVGSLRQVNVASILNNVVRYQSDVKDAINDYVDDETKAAEGEKKEIILALESFYNLYQELNS